MMRTIVGVLLAAALGFAPAAFAQKATTTTAAVNGGATQSAQAQAVAADQAESCRQHVIQLTEESRNHQKRLATLRADRRVVGVSGGEMARFKLASIDQEIRDLSKQNASIATQIDIETNRCEGLAAKASVVNRAPQPQSQPQAQSQPQPTTKPKAKNPRH